MSVYLKDNLANLRKNKRLQISEVSTFAQVEEANLKAWEDGMAVPAQEDLEKLAKFYGVSTADLLSPIKIPKPKMSKKKKLLVTLTSIVSFILVTTIIFSILAAVQGGNIHKDLRGTYYLARINVDNTGGHSTQYVPDDIDSAIAKLKSELKWFNTTLTVNEKKQIVFEGKEPIKFRLFIQDNIPDWFISMGPNSDGFYSGRINFPNKEIISQSNYWLCTTYGLGRRMARDFNSVVIRVEAVDGKSYELRYYSDYSESLEYNNSAANYKVNRMYTRITGMPDQEVPTTDPNYSTYKTSYGETIKLFDSRVEFSGTLTIPLNSKAGYTKSGNKITFTDSMVSSIYSAELDGDKFSLIISLSADAMVIIEYTVTT